MARSASHFVCQQCGASHRKWTGRCDDCGAWNSVTEEAVAEAAPKGVSGAGGRPVSFVPLEGSEEQRPRITTGIGEFDRVCGGGLVAGSALLVGGDPGIGKSTLLLQAMAGLASAGTAVAYISGEEAVDQIRLRAARLRLASA
ncbi:MAG: AAA family ATPase, partial [Alphaproteobacteria bacterium]|nr:AAA family ATPase [Alphaproteobacteria bacterium]